MKGGARLVPLRAGWPGAIQRAPQLAYYPCIWPPPSQNLPQHVFLPLMQPPSCMVKYPPRNGHYPLLGDVEWE
jgi:hypothetical protein